MDLNKAILYGQLVNEAYKVPTSDLKNRAGTTLTAERGPNKTTFEVIASIYANDLAKDAKKTGPTDTVSIGLVLWQASTGEAVIAIRGTEGLLEWFQNAQIGTEKCPFTEEIGRASCRERV